MDAPQFDALSKALSGGDTRRRVLGALAAVPALGGLAALLGPDEADAKKRRAKHRHAVDAEKKKKKKKKCKPPTTKCGKKCFNLQTDSANCGGCGVACAAGTACKGGTCTCSGANCGGCGASCNTCCNDVCCTQAGAICAEDTGACCVPESESQTCAGKCGGIFNNCGVKINCGDCACQPGSCPACQICNGNPLQCNPDPGQQGDTCSPSQCQNSTFTPAGACNGAGTCVVGSPSSCAPYRCDGAFCGTSCSSGAQCTQNAFCNGSGHCELFRQNGQACNADQECGSGHCVDGVCCNSACDGACEACNLAGSEGTCTNESNGLACGGGNVCCSGACQECCGNGQCSNPEPVCVSGTCNACSASNPCGNGEVCCNGSCFTGICCESSDCGSGSNACAGHQCQCGSGNACSGGSPDCCGAPGDCTDTDTDPDNCGSCGHACSGATPHCLGGHCVCGDVCASGCTYSTIQEAINAANDGDTIRICPGTYGRAGDNPVAFINKNLTLVGAGQGAGGTFLDGASIGSQQPLVQVVGLIGGGVNDLIVELRDLKVTGGVTNTQNGRGGGVLVARGTASLTRVLVTGNFAAFGGGIALNDTQSKVILTDTTVTGNSVGSAGNGGGIYNPGQVILNGSSSVTGNTPDQCINVDNGTGCPA